MKKQLPLPRLRLILQSCPPEAIGVSVPTMQRRRQHPESLTIEELLKALAYLSAAGKVPANVTRELIEEDFKASW